MPYDGGGVDVAREVNPTDECPVGDLSRDTQEGVGVHRSGGSKGRVEGCELLIRARRHAEASQRDGRWEVRFRAASCKEGGGEIRRGTDELRRLARSYACKVS